jgi:hypothetical protein
MHSYLPSLLTAANAVGGAVYPPNDPDDRNAIVQLPQDDVSFNTFLYHPPYIADVLGFARPNPACDQVPRRKTIEQAQARFLKLRQAARSANSNAYEGVY